MSTHLVSELFATLIVLPRHVSHSVFLPMTALNVPIGHGLQFSCVGNPLNVPGSQNSHDVAPFEEKLPASHVLHVD